jgi:hypothetical protein
LHNADDTGHLKGTTGTWQRFLSTNQAAYSEQPEAECGPNCTGCTLDQWPWIKWMSRVVLFWKLWKF